MNETTLPTFTGRSEFSAAVLQAFGNAASANEREICLADVDFSAWPLGDPALLATLTGWAKQPHRRLTLIACHFDDLPRRHPRFVSWRRTWAHVMACREAPEVDVSEMPGLLLAGPHSLQLLDRHHLRGRWLPRAEDRRTWAEVVDAILQRSQEGFPANRLGL
jgi:hypothetical protein